MNVAVNDRPREGSIAACCECTNLAWHVWLLIEDGVRYLSFKMNDLMGAVQIHCLRCCLWLNIILWRPQPLVLALHLLELHCLHCRLWLWIINDGGWLSLLHVDYVFFLNGNDIETRWVCCISSLVLVYLSFSTPLCLDKDANLTVFVACKLHVICKLK